MKPLPKVQLPIDLEPGLKERLAALASERDSNVNDATSAILAEAFGVEYESTGVRGSGVGPSETICLEVPDELRERINERHRAENRRRWRAREAKLSRSAFLNPLLRDYLDARMAA